MSKQTNDNNISDNSNIANPNVIKDTSNNLEFDVDWETIEKNYKYDSHHHRHHRHHSSSNSDKPTDFNNNSSTNVDKSENFDANASTNKQKHNKLKKDDQTNTHKHKNVKDDNQTNNHKHKKAKDDNQNLKKKHKKLKIFLIILLSLLIIIAIVLGVLNYMAGRSYLITEISMLMFHQEYNMKMTGELYTTMDILMNLMTILQAYFLWVLIIVN